MRRTQRVVATVAVAVAVSVVSGCAQQLGGTVFGAADGVTGTGRVISATIAESSGTVDSATLQGRLVAGHRDDVPEGYHRAGVIVSSGLGSFTVAVPADYRAMWWPGEPAGDFVAEVTRLDPRWGAQARRITAGDPARSSVRALILDGSGPDVRMLVVTAGKAPGGGPAGLMADARASLRTSDARIIDLHPVVANGVDWIYAEYLQPDGGQHVPSRAAMAVWLTDPRNDLQWGVSCDVPAGQRDEQRAQRLRIAGSFRPLPAVSPYSGLRGT